MEPSVIGGTGQPEAELGGYRIHSVLGEGGMATVYLAERPQGGLCALKVLSRRRDEDLGYAARFKREAQYAEELDHPHILELYEAGEAPDGSLYLAMQYVPGADLGVLLAREGAMALPRVLAILGQIGDALDCAHAKGLIHRDVKPGNILVAADPGTGPYAYLSDFGLSKNPDQDSIALTKQGQFVGTTAYTAPEEILAQPRDHRVDIYSLGCVLFEALVGEPPFVRDQELDVMYAHIGDPRPQSSDRRPDLPPELDAVIAKAMAISPEDRYASCAEFIAAATALLPDGAVPAPDAPRVPIPSPQPVDESVEPGSGTGPPAALRLVVRTGPASGSELLVDGDIALGRLTTLNGALTDDHEISRRHASVHRTADGHFVVEDEQSSNGTFVNGTRIEGAYPLNPGDELKIGSTTFEVAMAASPASASAEAVPAAEPQAPDTASAEKPQPQAPDTASAEKPQPMPVAEVVVQPSPSEPLKKVAVRLEIDLEAGEVSVAIEHGASARIVRGPEGWRVEIP
jgi:serine/threonine protein kinase